MAKTFVPVDYSLMAPLLIFLGHWLFIDATDYQLIAYWLTIDYSLIMHALLCRTFV